jgi:hypothetical protein
MTRSIPLCGRTAGAHPAHSQVAKLALYMFRNDAFQILATLSTGCNNGTNTDLSYKTAINDHFKAFTTCIWSEATKFPVQAATSDDSKTALDSNPSDRASLVMTGDRSEFAK